MGDRILRVVPPYAFGVVSQERLIRTSQRFVTHVAEGAPPPIYTVRVLRTVLIVLAAARELHSFPTRKMQKGSRTGLGFQRGAEHDLPGFRPLQRVPEFRTPLPPGAKASRG